MGSSTDALQIQRELLSAIEAMNCGLPTFATDQGGPAEILVDGISGFHIDPNDGDGSSNKMADFFEKCKTDAGYWNKMSAECSMCEEKNVPIPEFVSSTQTPSTSKTKTQETAPTALVDVNPTLI
ncbi:hypothetical protein OIU77_000873 [Salix suchowensis]|uniref:sucrose synthase n=1 Tax=Salix suchowensis TaxID=1278906 RepID=A0ABQ9BA18_9ROSI|nr:hypothetical protein OIU77_000873 [Salix suchowensis]